MLDRYTRKEMGRVWTLQNRYLKMLEVEKAVASIQGELSLIPKEAAQAIKEKAGFKLENILKNEEQTKHDVTAFVQEVARSVGEPYGSYVHWGLTSSDVLDSALALLIREASVILRSSFLKLQKALLVQIEQHSGTLQSGRTHGILAEPLTFGWKLSGFLLELKRNENRVFQAIRQAEVAKFSGAVGAYGTGSPDLEKKVCRLLGLSSEPVATQVVARDRYAEVILSLAMTASGLERLAVEIRHLQRTEVSEVSESFSQGQMGSSAMPHKKNPIYSENITGLSRLIRSYVIPALENIVLWHERDISHSSVERVVFPSAFIFCDFALHRMAEVIQNLQIHSQQMQKNMETGQGIIYSSVLLKALIKKGMSRSSAYELIQKESFAISKTGEHLKDRVLKNKQILKYLSADEIQKIFSFNDGRQQIDERVKHILKSL